MRAHVVWSHACGLVRPGAGGRSVSPDGGFAGVSFAGEGFAGISFVGVSFAGVRFAVSLFRRGRFRRYSALPMSIFMEVVLFGNRFASIRH